MWSVAAELLAIGEPFLSGAPCSRLPCGRQPGPRLSAALRLPGAEAVPQSGAESLQRCLGSRARPCSQVEPFQSKIANSSEGLALFSRHDLLGMIKHFHPQRYIL